jgi:ATP-dependent Clp protease adaptor protein ClpS
MPYDQNDSPNDSSIDQDHDGGQADTLLKPKPKAKKPSMYKVILLNDDYTPMDFVIHILEKFFHKNNTEAAEIMMQVHRRGVGVCGIYTFEIAETKVTQVMDYARKNEQPLQCTMEKE